MITLQNPGCFPQNPPVYIVQQKIFWQSDSPLSFTFDMPPFWIIFEGVSPSYVMDKIDESVYFIGQIG